MCGPARFSPYYDGEVEMTYFDFLNRHSLLSKFN